MEKAKSNVHPWQRRTIGGSFSGDTLLEYGGEELGPKSGRVAWKDPDDIKQEEQTIEVREDQLQPAKEREVKRKTPTKLALAQDFTNEEVEVSEEENRVGHGAASLRSVEESPAVVNIMELPNFQIDQATSLIQVKGLYSHLSGRRRLSNVQRTIEQLQELDMEVKLL